MSPVNGKQKGNAYERSVAKLLTNLFGAEFYRTAHSGAYTGKSNSFRRDSMSSETAKAFVGDIIPPEGYNIVIECKNYASIRGGFNGIVAGDCAGLEGWIGEVHFDSRNELPHLLFFKINKLGQFIALPKKFFDLEANDKLVTELALTYTRYYYTNNEGTKEVYYVISDYYLSGLSELIKQVIYNGKR